MPPEDPSRWLLSGAAAALPAADREVLLADPARIDRLGLRFCLRYNLVPLQRPKGGRAILATGRPADLPLVAPIIRQRLGEFRIVTASGLAVQDAILDCRGAALDQVAQNLLPPGQSCASLGLGAAAKLLLPALVVVASVSALVGPVLLLAGLAFVLLILSTGLRSAAMVAAVRASRAAARVAGPAPSIPMAAERTPEISILVPLLREERIAGALVDRLSALDYPADRLEVLLIVEAGDQLTQRALQESWLPVFMKIVLVPPGQVQTKPRALNYALALARGSIIGVYDAEDAPEPDQLRKVVSAFAAAPPDLVCLQGALDFYNPRQSLLTRLFTLDYACWFRVILPGLAQMGLVLPLGGTSLFFRRHALDSLGGWDAWNVTEDADLGVRLARCGWKTGLLPSTTYEEATSRALPWVRQRSRWIKGYAMTWASHTRAPVALLRELGTRRFLALQLMLLAPVLQPLLAPVLWSFWGLAFSLPHPLTPVFGDQGMLMLILLFLLCEAINLAACMIALRATVHRRLWLLAPGMQIYGWLATFALWKALAELLWNRFYWDKTMHGHSQAAQLASIRRASTRSLVS